MSNLSKHIVAPDSGRESTHRIFTSTGRDCTGASSSIPCYFHSDKEAIKTAKHYIRNENPINPLTGRPLYQCCAVEKYVGIWPKDGKAFKGHIDEIWRTNL